MLSLFVVSFCVVVWYLQYLFLFCSFFLCSNCAVSTAVLWGTRFSIIHKWSSLLQCLSSVLIVNDKIPLDNQVQFVQFSSAESQIDRSQFIRLTRYSISSPESCSRVSWDVSSLGIRLRIFFRGPASEKDQVA